MGKAFAEKGWEVTSLDLDPKTEATIKQNILTWNFSARRGAKKPRDLEVADTLIKKPLKSLTTFSHGAGS